MQTVVVVKDQEDFLQRKHEELLEIQAAKQKELIHAFNETKLATFNMLEEFKEDTQQQVVRPGDL
jgi:tellurite resistance protein